MGQTLKEGGTALEKKTLEAVRDRIRLRGIKAEVRQVDWKGKPLNLVTAELLHFGDSMDTCFGEYFFKPIPGDPDGGRYFCALITLRNDVPLEHIPELAFGLSILNFYIGNGCFALNKPTDLLVYKGVRTIPGDTPEENLENNCFRQMEEAHDIAAKYCTPLLALAEGSMELQRFVQLMKVEY